MQTLDCRAVEKLELLCCAVCCEGVTSCPVAHKMQAEQGGRPPQLPVHISWQHAASSATSQQDAGAVAACTGTAPPVQLTVSWL